MTAMVRVLLLALAANGAVAASTDAQVSALADTAIQERCEASFIGDFDETADRQALENVLGNDNFILDILTQAESNEEVGTLFADWAQEDGQDVIRRRAVGFVMLILMLAMFPCFCTTACPCCVRCRVGRPKDEPRHTSIVFKFVGLVATAAIGLGIFICWGYAWSAHAKINDGVDNLGCTGARMVKATLDGQEDPKFIGMNGMVREFQDLSSVLDSNSEFLTGPNGLNALLDDTQDIDVSIYLASQTLDLLSDMMRQNSNPGGSHTCDFCSQLGDQISPVAGALGDSLAAALNDARAEVKEQLNEANREDMKRLLSESIDPVEDMKDKIRDALEPVVEQDSWSQIQKIVNDAGKAAVMLMVGLAALLAVIGISACGLFVVKEGSESEGYTRSVHRSACCTWMCAWILCFFCFFFGGYLEVMAVPLSGVCLTLDDVSGQTLLDIRQAVDLDVDPNSDEFVILKDSVDKCLNPADPNVPANFADILFFRDANNNSKITLRQQLQSTLEQSITAQFDELSRQIEDNVQSNLANEQVVLDIQSFLRNQGPKIANMIITDRDQFSQPASWAGYRASVACTDESQVLGVPGFITAENADLGGVQLNFPPSLCPGTPAGDGTQQIGIDCTGNADVPQCTATNTLLTEKNRVMTGAEFRCDVFETDNGQACDVLDMVQTNAQTNNWANDCLRSDGTLSRKEVTCTLDEFEAYTAAFDQRIGLTMARVDATTSAVSSQINDDMRALIQTEILDPVNGIINGVQCNWLAQYYQEVIWGICYQGTVGLNKIGMTYVGLGFLLVCLIAVMYALWRRAVDNVKLRDAKVQG